MNVLAGMLTSDIVLTEAVAMRPDPDYIADRIFSYMPTMNRTGKITLLDPTMDSAIAEDNIRSPGSRANRSSYNVSRPQTYTCEERSEEVVVPIEAFETQEVPLKSLEPYARLAQRKMRIKNELNALAAVQAACTGSLTASPANKWNATTGTPVSDLISYAETVKVAAGARPNQCFMDSNTLYAISLNPQFRDGRGISDDFVLNQVAAQLGAMIGMEVIPAMAATYNSAKPGQTAVGASIWGENVILKYNEPTIEALTATPFINCVWQPESPELQANGQGGLVGGWRVDTWYDLPTKSWFVRTSYYSSMTTLRAAGNTQIAAYLVTNTLA